MGVSRSGYCGSAKRNDPRKIDPDFPLISKVREIPVQAKKKYGSRRISERFRAKGRDVGRYKARGPTGKASVSAIYRKKCKSATDSGHDRPVAGHPSDRRFDAERPNTVWRTDIAYSWSNEGRLYPAVVFPQSRWSGFRRPDARPKKGFGLDIGESCREGKCGFRIKTPLHGTNS